MAAPWRPAVPVQMAAVKSGGAPDVGHDRNAQSAGISGKFGLRGPGRQAGAGMTGHARET